MKPTSPLSHLPWPTDAILDTLADFDQATSSQLRRLHYQGTDRGTKARSSYHLKRLSELGEIKRSWCVYTGMKEYYYMLPPSEAQPDRHTLDLTELYVRFVERLGEVHFTTETWTDTRVGSITMTPDAYLELGYRKFFIEMDEGTEKPARLKVKMKRYYDVWSNQWNVDVHGDTFPPVIWVARNQRSIRNIKAALRTQPEPRLFKMIPFDDVVERLLGTQ